MLTTTAKKEQHIILIPIPYDEYHPVQLIAEIHYFMRMEGNCINIAIHAMHLHMKQKSLV